AYIATALESEGRFEESGRCRVVTWSRMCVGAAWPSRAPVPERRLGEAHGREIPRPEVVASDAGTEVDCSRRSLNIHSAPMRAPCEMPSPSLFDQPTAFNVVASPGGRIAGARTTGSGRPR